MNIKDLKNRLEKLEQISGDAEDQYVITSVDSPPERYETDPSHRECFDTIRQFVLEGKNAILSEDLPALPDDLDETDDANKFEPYTDAQLKYILKFVTPNKPFAMSFLERVKREVARRKKL